LDIIILIADLTDPLLTRVEISIIEQCQFCCSIYW